VRYDFRFHKLGRVGFGPVLPKGSTQVVLSISTNIDDQTRGGQNNLDTCQDPTFSGRHISSTTTYLRNICMCELLFVRRFKILS
jgi:hypothetical protein